MNLKLPGADFVRVVLFLFLFDVNVFQNIYFIMYAMTCKARVEISLKVIR